MTERRPSIQPNRTERRARSAKHDRKKTLHSAKQVMFGRTVPEGRGALGAGEDGAEELGRRRERAGVRERCWGRERRWREGGGAEKGKGDGTEEEMGPEEGSGTEEEMGLKGVAGERRKGALLGREGDEGDAERGGEKTRAGCEEKRGG